jgi:hypothetical protein
MRSSYENYILTQVIPLEYLKDLHALHEEWLMTPHSNVPAKILVVDVDQVSGLYTFSSSKVVQLNS